MYAHNTQSNGDNYRVILAITYELFKAEDRRHNKQILSLYNKNQMAVNKTHDAFSFAGRNYIPVSLSRGSITTAPLAISLVPEMVSHLADKKAIDHDKKIIEQTLFKLIYPCRTLQDYRDALPDCLKDMLPSIAAFSRTQPEAFTLADDTRGMSQYLKILPKMEFYSVVRLVY